MYGQVVGGADCTYSDDINCHALACSARETCEGSVLTIPADFGRASEASNAEVLIRLRTRITASRTAWVIHGPRRQMKHFRSFTLKGRIVVVQRGPRITSLSRDGAAEQALCLRRKVSKPVERQGQRFLEW